jgi:hypothetical protein
MSLSFFHLSFLIAYFVFDMLIVRIKFLKTFLNKKLLRLSDLFLADLFSVKLHLY